MVTQSAVLDTIEVLLGRSGVVERLSVEPTAKRDLIDGLDVSRSTVDRAIREIESLGLVESGDDGVTFTLCGRLAAEEFERFGSRLADRCGVGDATDSVIADLIATAVRQSELLDVLDQPLDKRDLVDELDRSRSTIDRTMRELEVIGVVKYVPEGFAPTEIGDTLVREYGSFVDRLDNTLAASNLLSVLDPAVDLDAAMLAGAEIVTQKPVAPHVPGTQLVELIREADRLTCVTHAHSHPRAMETVYSLANDGVEMTFVFPAPLLDHVRSLHPDRFSRILGLANYKTYAVDETPYGLFLVETPDGICVRLLVYNRDNEMKGMISNSSSEAVEWGKQVYQSHENRAEPVTA